MSNNNVEPSKTDFDNAEEAILDTVSTRFPRLLTKVGSVVRELLVRPMAYLYAWLAANMTARYDATKMSRLMMSRKTSNQDADAIASNYFVERLSGARAKGAITVVSRVQMLDLKAGYGFSVGGTRLMTERRVVALPATTARIEDGVQYVPLYTNTGEPGTYYATIPVVTVGEGAIELPAGTPVEQRFGTGVIVSAVLTSSVSGGRGVETDADMFARARINTADAGIGSYYGLKKKAARCPVSVVGLNPVAGEASVLYRARYNTTGLNPGGVVDCYVKTQNQYAVDDMQASGTQGNSFVFQDNAHAGLYGVVELYDDNGPVNDYTVAFGTTDGSSTWKGARLGTAQTLLVSGEGLTGNLHAKVAYMPGLYQVQQFLNADDAKYVGQSIQVKAAVPVTVRINCTLRYDGQVTDTVLDAVKQAMVSRVNAYEVGSRILNFSDLQDAVAATVPGADIRLPCTFVADTFLADGSSDSMHSNAGVLNIASPVGPGYWGADVCFFSTTKDNIRLDIA